MESKKPRRNPAKNRLKLFFLILFLMSASLNIAAEEDDTFLIDRCGKMLGCTPKEVETYKEMTSDPDAAMKKLEAIDKELQKQYEFGEKIEKKTLMNDFLPNADTVFSFGVDLDKSVKPEESWIAIYLNKDGKTVFSAYLSANDISGKKKTFNIPFMDKGVYDVEATGKKVKIQTEKAVEKKAFEAMEKNEQEQLQKAGWGTYEVLMPSSPQQLAEGDFEGKKELRSVTAAQFDFNFIFNKTLDEYKKFSEAKIFERRGVIGKDGQMFKTGDLGKDKEVIIDYRSELLNGAGEFNVTQRKNGTTQYLTPQVKNTALQATGYIAKNGVIEGEINASNVVYGVYYYDVSKLPKGTLCENRLPTFWMLNLGSSKDASGPLFEMLMQDQAKKLANVNNMLNKPAPRLGTSADTEMQRILNPGLFQFGVRVSF